MTDHVLTEPGPGVLTIRLNRPDKRNALTQEMYAALVDAFARAEADDSVRVILLAGTNGCFTAGNDLADFLAGPTLDLAGPTISFIKALATTRKILVAEVEGPAVGIGTTMLLHCDLVYATANTKLALPFVPLGLVPEAASTLLLPRLAGPQAAAHLLLFGEPFTAAEAATYGLVTEVFPDGEALRARVAERLAALLAKPPVALAATRRLLRGDTEVAEVVARVEAEAVAFGERMSSDEAKAAIAAVLSARSGSGRARG